MKTTITLDPDVQALLRTTMKERGVSLKEAINSAIRAGLTQNRPRRVRYTQHSVSLGAEQNFCWDQVLEVAAVMEDEELTRKISRRK